MEKLINLFKKSSSMFTKLVEIKAINKQLMSFLDALRNLKTQNFQKKFRNFLKYSSFILTKLMNRHRIASLCVNKSKKLKIQKKKYPEYFKSTSFILTNLIVLKAITKQLMASLMR